MSVARWRTAAARVVPLGELSGQVFFLGGISDWPPFESDCLYVETEPFDLPAFGFLASLLPLS